jgi:hypothetical protein
VKKRLGFFIIIFLGGISCFYLLVVPFPIKKIAQHKVFRGIAWFRFDQQNALSGWEEKVFKGKVSYRVEADKNDTYLEAYSRNAASGIVRWLKFNPIKYPYVSWRWKVLQFPGKKKGSYQDNWWIEKDDYAARFYIIFPRFPFFRYQCLEYVWDEFLPKGTVLTNPSYSGLKIIVAESGRENLGKWVDIERNLNEDFKKYFGGTPGNVGAIAIMTDADNTTSTAEAQYNDIEVGYEK